MKNKRDIDIKENDLLKIDSSLLAALLKDMTTGHNILWCTDNYEKYGKSYAADRQIRVEQITSRRGSIIKPRTEKSKAEQQQRVKQKGEVFTPAWICNMQNNCADEAWFGKKNIFNTEKGHSWETMKGKIIFPDEKNKTWQDYVFAKRLEITCGEAPYLASRYDAATGTFIEVPDRIGILDRKLRIVSENAENCDDWIKWAYFAVQNIYGFDWQGDNVLIARENVLFTVAEHYEAKFGKKIDKCDLIGFAKVIAWNIWQMDGLKFVIPNSCCNEEIIEEDLFGRRVVSKICEGCKKGNNAKHNGIYCIIKDWEMHRNIRFADIAGGINNGF